MNKLACQEKRQKKTSQHVASLIYSAPQDFLDNNMTKEADLSRGSPIIRWRVARRGIHSRRNSMSLSNKAPSINASKSNV